MSRVDWQAGAGSPLRGELAVPGDKSVSHRAIMLGALAEGSSEVHGFLEGEDTLATAAAFAAMGVRIESADEGRRVVHGVGLHGLQAPTADLDCGNAGTGMRLLAGLLCGQRFDSRLVGDASLSRRPMRRVIAPLERMGARIGSAAGDVPPLAVCGGRVLSGMDHRLEIASAQVKSAILLAGLYARGDTTVVEPHPTRDYTERMLQAFGWPLRQEGAAVVLGSGGTLRATRIDVPGDFSSAAFFLVAASIVPGSDLLLRGVGLNRRRTGLLLALRAMGADIVIDGEYSRGGERLGDLRVRHRPLHGVEVPVALVADMIDEFPALFVAAACAEGVTTVSGAAELRVKESDRLAAMTAALRTLGVAVEECPDGARIEGRGQAALGGGSIDSRGDHRIAMAAAVAAQRSGSAVRIIDCANVATSFPGFDSLARALGFGLSPVSATLGAPSAQEQPR